MSVYKCITPFLLAIIYHSALFGASASETVLIPRLTPLWADSNQTQCSIHHDEDGQVAYFQGDPNRTCSAQVMTDSGAATLIKIPKREDNASFFSLYFEKEGVLGNCESKYVLIREQRWACNVAIVRDIIKLYLRGDVNLTMIQISAMNASSSTQTEGSFPSEVSSTSGSSPSSCLKDSAEIFYDDDATQELEITWCDTKVFNYTLTCDLEVTSSCRITLPVDCNNTIGPHQVTYSCPESTSKNQSVLVLYPDDTSVLDLSWNNIARLETHSFSGLLLRVLYLYDNQMEELIDGDFHGLRYLEQLWLSGNKLTKLESGVFQGLHNLDILALYENRMVDLNIGLFRELTRLTRLDLDTCQLRALSVGVFQGLRNLNKLYLYSNHLVRLDVGLFDELTSLRFLSFSNNELIDLPVGVFHGLGSLNSLYLYGNRLVTLDVGLFWDVPRLTSLSLAKNALATIPPALFHKMSNLMWLFLQSNELVTLDAESFLNSSKLTYIDLSDNNLTGVPQGVFQGLVMLKSLFLQLNDLSSVDKDLFQGLSALKVLALQENSLTEIDEAIFRDLGQLESLGLGGNSFPTLGYALFKNLFNLNSLFLNDNGLVEIDADMFRDTTALALIDLSLNELKTIPDIKHLSHLAFLDLTGNPLTWINRSLLISLPRDAELYVSQHEICECYIPAGVNCSAADNRSPYLTCDRLLSDRVLLVLMWVIGLNAFGGNLFVLAWRRNTTQKNRVQAMLLSNLAWSDLLMGVYMIIIASVDVYYGRYFPMHSEIWRSGVICRMAGALSITSCEASVFFVTLISIDRLISVRFPYSTKKFGKRSITLIVVVTWLISLVLGIAPSIVSGDNFMFYDNSHVCIGLPLALTEMFTTQSLYKQVEKDGYVYFTNTFITQSKGLVSGMYYSVALFLGLNCLCYLAICGCYAEIVRAVYKSSKRAGLNREMRHQIRMTAKVAAIVVTDFCCWFPIIIMGILVQARIVTLPPSVYAWSVTFVLPINSAINPYLYTIAAIVSSRQKLDEASASTSTNSTQVRSQGHDQNVQLATVSTAITQHADVNGPGDILPNVPMHCGNDVSDA